MAKIPLRSYFREIESLVERGMNEEAAAHCRFILKYYPKSIDTYRLLSKAFLESQRYSEAADILQRILSVVPDDFFALIGMSITREDEGNLDAAIFYMERAYETQPANVAVQDELRRLYGRRDGVEPPKLRLSRGALVRMYHKGGLNRQAIAEINAALKEDPQRTDLEIILARIHMDLGEKIPSFELASRILAKLPFCYDAIQILVNILPTTAHAEDTQKYVERLISLDPYVAFISSSCPTVQQVPDNAVIIDRLDWQASQGVAQQPSWAQTIGVTVEAEPAESSPDWLRDVSAGEATPSETVENQPQIQTEEIAIQPVEPSENKIPDWMQQAGWAVSDGTAVEPVQAFEPDEELEDGSEPAKADLPDWLKELAPDVSDLTEEGSAEDQAKIGLLEQILPPVEPLSAKPSSEAVILPVEGGEVEVSSDSTELPQETLDFLAGLPSPELEASQIAEFSNPAEPTPEPPVEQLPEENQPVTLGEITEEAIPDWIANLEAFQPTETQLPGEVEQETTTPQSPVETDLPMEFQPEPFEAISAEPLPDWLQEIAASQTTDASIEGISQASVSVESSGMDFKEPPAAETIPAISESEEEITPETMTIPDVQIEEAPTIPEPDAILTDETAPQPVVDQIIPEVVEPESVEAGLVTAATPAETSEPDFSDADAALAWLESLAAKQGAAEETLITPPEERLETAPDWVQALASMEVAEQQPGEKLAEEAIAGEQVPDESEVAEVEIEIIKSELQPVDLVEPLVVDEKQAESEMPSVSLEPASTEGTQAAQPPAVMDFDTAFAWLESLAAQQGASEETLLTPAEERPSATPDFPQSEFAEEEAASPTQPVKITFAIPSEEIEQMPAESVSDEVTDFAHVIVEPPAEPPILEEKSAEMEVQPEVDQKTVDETLLPTMAEEPKHTGKLAPLPDWLQGISSEPEIEEPQTIEPTSAELPDWLKGLESVVESQPQTQSTSEPLPEWLNDIEKAPAEPTVEEAQPESEKAPEWIQGLVESEENQAAEAAGTLTQEDLQRFDELEAIPAGTETPQLLLNAAQSALAAGKIEISMRYYARLIQNRMMIEETIHDLRDALYRYPVDISIWQMLGDAYLRNNQIQDALDAYTKAEEFLR